MQGRQQQQTARDEESRSPTTTTLVAAEDMLLRHGFGQQTGQPVRTRAVAAAVSSWTDKEDFGTGKDLVRQQKWGGGGGRGGAAQEGDTSPPLVSEQRALKGGDASRPLLVRMIDQPPAAASAVAAHELDRGGGALLPQSWDQGGLQRAEIRVSGHQIFGHGHVPAPGPFQEGQQILQDRTPPALDGSSAPSVAPEDQSAAAIFLANSRRGLTSKPASNSARSTDSQVFFTFITRF